MFFSFLFLLRKYTFYTHFIPNLSQKSLLGLHDKLMAILFKKWQKIEVSSEQLVLRMLVGYILSNAKIHAFLSVAKKSPNTISAHCILFLAGLTILFPRSRAHFTPFAYSTLVYTTRHKEWVTSSYFIRTHCLTNTASPAFRMWSSLKLKLNVEKINEPQRF